MNIVWNELKRNFKTFCIWGIILAGLVLMVMAIYPSFSADMDAMQDMYASMGSFSDMFGLDKLSITTAAGFYGLEAGVMLCLGGSMYAAMMGIGSLSKEEEKHTAEFLLTHPIGRVQAITEKLVALLLQILFMNGVFLLSGIIGFAIAGEDLTKEFYLFHGGILIMMLEVGLICFGISAFLRQSAIGIGLGFAALLYFCSLLANISDKFEMLKCITPFQYADAAYIYEEGRLDGGLIGIGCALAAVMLLAGYTKYIKKDIAA